MTSTKLIALYCAICEQYNTFQHEVQRLSNNYRPKFSDEEAMTIYVWGVMNGIYEQKAVYDFIKIHYQGWFPKLPSYKKFSKRLGLLSHAFAMLAESLMMHGTADYIGQYIMQAIDSMPVIVASQARSSSARSCAGFCNKSYNASKKQYYYGVKLHICGVLRQGTIPLPTQLAITPASVFDLTAAKQMLSNQHGFALFADKAYCSESWREELASRNITLFTPKKRAKGQSELSLTDGVFSSIVSSERQPIETFFSWLISKTRIQSASKVRSLSGLLLHIFGKLVVALFLLLGF